MARVSTRAQETAPGHETSVRRGGVDAIRDQMGCRGERRPAQMTMADGVEHAGMVTTPDPRHYIGRHRRKLNQRLTYSVETSGTVRRDQAING
jgi:hypothetical protein